MPSRGQPSLPPTTSVQGHLARTTIVLPTPGFGSDVFGHGWLLWLRILSPHVLSLMLGWNLDLEIVAIHPDSGGNRLRPNKRTERAGDFPRRLSSFRGTSETSEPGIHNHDQEYGFRSCASGRQLPVEDASRDDDS